MYEANRLFDKKLGWDTETDKDTDGISESMVREFMREHYVPSNMILMAKDDPEMLRFVEALPRGRIMKDESRFAPNLPRARGRKLVTRKLDHIYVSNVSFWFAAPQSVAVKERTLIELGGMIIKERIVDASLKDIVSHGSGCNYSANRAFGSFELSIRQIHPTDSGLAMKLIEREVERVKRDVTDEEFERAKKKTIEQVKDSLEDGEVGSYFDEVLYNYDDVVTTIKSLFSATKENVMETMLEYLDLNDCMVVVTEPGAEQS
jgi:predicted Zn-dependent peptidase